MLELLADGPMTRLDLHDETSIHLLADDFGELLATVESIGCLGDVIQQLPTDLVRVVRLGR